MAIFECLLFFRRFEIFEIFHPGKADKFCSHAFKVFDTDNSGEIDFPEFLIAISITAQGDIYNNCQIVKWFHCEHINNADILLDFIGDIRKKLVLAFKMYDVDGNGINEAMTNRNIHGKNQFCFFCSKKGKADKKEMEKIIEAIYDLLGEEKNRKGENSPHERVKTIMAKLDKDNNGYLSESEFVEGCINDPVLLSLLAPNAS
jgi:Ca2+-binding EF-hand superfamily protein